MRIKKLETREMAGLVLALTFLAGLVGGWVVKKTLFPPPLSRAQVAGTQITAGEPFTTTLSIWWDKYAESSGEPTRWASLVELDLRKGNEVIERRSIVPDCAAASVPSVGQCGSPIVVAWDTSGLGAGSYAIMARLTWVNTTTGEVVYGQVEGESVHDGQHFYPFQEFDVAAQTYLPLIFKRR